MSEPSPQLWDALPQVIGKLKNEFLLVTLGILILVVAIGAFAPGVVESLGAAFFYLIVVLAWLAYVVGRTFDAWLKLRAPDAPGSTPQEPPQSQTQPDAPAFDQREQTVNVNGPQTNVGQSEGPILSGEFHGPVTIGATPKPPAAAAPAADQGELGQLHQVLSARFSREELRTLCFNLGVDYDDLPAEGRDARARELVGFMSRRGELDRLRAAIQAERPGALR